MKKVFVALASAAALAASAVVIAEALANAHDVTKGGPIDLIVDQKILQNHWIIRDENIPANACSAIEGGISGGEHRLLRFAVSTPNIGTGDLFLGDPNEHIAANDGLYEFATCHNHFHFRHYALYELIGPDGHVWRAAKRGFCMIDVAPAPQSADFTQKTWAYRSCGRPGTPGNQGISAGWADEYWWFLGGQYFVLDGGDGQAVVPPGIYTIRITVNPGFVPTKNEPIGFASPDPNHPGVYHQLPETNYENNVATATVVVTDHPGRTGVGPAVGESEPKPDKNAGEVIDDPK